ncbi:MAG: FAD-binding oxidoreductase [Fimbriimonadaceae bacterium]|nr:FAD-binding oxidoreductase [Fimbriimonadaceae bacterium]
MTVLDPARIARVSGFGFTASADGYVYRPTSVDEVRRVFELARETGRHVVLRGAGRSYGDANIGAEALVLDCQRMRRVLSWDPASGVLDVEAGATIQDLWKIGLEDGYWPPVVSGTMAPTLGGALGMNIHGKNAYRVGTLGDQVLDLDVLTPAGDLLTLTPDDDDFYAVVSGAGLLGAIVRVRIKLKEVHSGDVRVLPVACRNWDEQFRTFEEYEPDADYMVSWVDCFGRGKQAGRGSFHAAWYLADDASAAATLRLDHQELPDTILGFFPKSVVWRVLRKLNNRTGMHFLNWAKYKAGTVLGDGKPLHQSLVAFSFLLDFVPNWQKAYEPYGFIQYQSFVPREQAPRVFAAQVRLQQEARLESYLGVLKRHRPDRFLFRHAVDGYSLALDFKVTRGNRERLWNLCHRMNDLVLEAGGRFYFAKDSTLRPQDASAFLGEEALARFREVKARYDPDALLTSGLAQRLDLV